MRRLVIVLSMLLSVCAAASAQTASVKPHIMRSIHYEQRVAHFDSLPPLRHHDFVMLGNSLTEFGGNWNILLYGREKGRMVNRGIIGDDAMGMYDRLYQILPAQPKKIFLMAGVNDISHNLSADSVVALVTTLVDRILKDSPRSHLYLQSLLPINEDFHRWKTMEGKTEVVVAVNESLRRLALSRGITFIDLFPLFIIPGTSKMRPELSLDGLHIRPAGYTIWAEALKPYLK
jgi:lysophospholipase L1-like esterase